MMNKSEISFQNKPPDQEVFEKILGLNQEVVMDATEMARNLTVTFFPYNENVVAKEIIDFKNRLEKTLIELNVTVIPFEKAKYKLPWGKVFKRLFRIFLNNFLYVSYKVLRLQYPNPFLDLHAIKKSLSRDRVAPGVIIFSLGEQCGDKLPIDWLSSFKKSSVVSIVPMPQNVDKNSSFLTHFDVAMNLFAHHMSHIIIAIDKEFWLLYNFNASHPVFNIQDDLSQALLSTLIPKLAAPISPVRMSEFTILKNRFNPFDTIHKSYVEDLVTGGKMLSETNLWPSGKKVNDLPFRNALYKWIGSVHLDSRSGMSYGFLARQLPSALSEVYEEEEAISKFGIIPIDNVSHYKVGGKILISFIYNSKKVYLFVPDVWVLTQRSGCDKTNMNPDTDLIKLGLSNGKMFLQIPTHFKLTNEFRTSFDTQVILAHAVGNTILASLAKHFFENNVFAKQIEEQGAAIGHWHGYLNPEHLPHGWHVYGENNLHVACSSPQSALYAISGKMRKFSQILESENIEYLGDVHIEPHHGSNIIFPSLQSLAMFLTKEENTAGLGNLYLNLW